MMNHGLIHHVVGNLKKPKLNLTNLAINLGLQLIFTASLRHIANLCIDFIIKVFIYWAINKSVENPA